MNTGDLCIGIRTFGNAILSSMMKSTTLLWTASLASKTLAKPSRGIVLEKNTYLHRLQPVRLNCMHCKRVAVLTASLRGNVVYEIVVLNSVATGSFKLYSMHCKKVYGVDRVLRGNVVYEIFVLNCFSRS